MTKEELEHMVTSNSRIFLETNSVTVTLLNTIWSIAGDYLMRLFDLCLWIEHCLAIFKHVESHGEFYDPSSLAPFQRRQQQIFECSQNSRYNTPIFEVSKLQNQYSCVKSLMQKREKVI